MILESTEDMVLVTYQVGDDPQNIVDSIIESFPDSTRKGVFLSKLNNPPEELKNKLNSFFNYTILEKEDIYVSVRPKPTTGQFVKGIDPFFPAKRIGFDTESGDSGKWGSVHTQKNAAPNRTVHKTKTK